MAEGRRGGADSGLSLEAAHKDRMQKKRKSLFFSRRKLEGASNARLDRVSTLVPIWCDDDWAITITISR